MNILIITSLYPTEKKNNLPDVTKAVHNLVKYWTKENRVVCIKTFRHTVIHPMRMLNKSFISNIIENKDVEVKDGVEIYTLEYCMLPLQRVMTYSMVNNISGRINKKMIDINFVPDIIISHMPLIDGAEQYIDKINGKCPRIAVLHRSDIDFLNNIFHKQALENNFDVIFSRSKAIYKLANKECISNLKEAVVFSGINAEIAVPQRSWKNLKQREIKLLYVGELIKQKAVDCIINILCSLSKETNVRLDIIGEGTERKSLERLVCEKQLKDKVFFWGKQSRENVYQQMAQSDIFIMISKHETLGLVYLEAMRMGCITIGSKDEGIDGIIIDNENGYLVEPLNDKELEVCLKNIINETAERLNEISINAIKTAEYYNEKDMAKKYLELVESVLD